VHVFVIGLSYKARPILMKCVWNKSANEMPHVFRLNTVSPCAKTGMVHPVSGWTRGVQLKLWDPSERVPYLSALEVCSRRGAIQIDVYLYLLPYYVKLKVHVLDTW